MPIGSLLYTGTICCRSSGRTDQIMIRPPPLPMEHPQATYLLPTKKSCEIATNTMETTKASYRPCVPNSLMPLLPVTVTVTVLILKLDWFRPSSRRILIPRDPSPWNAGMHAPDWKRAKSGTRERWGDYSLFPAYSISFSLPVGSHLAATLRTKNSTS